MPVTRRDFLAAAAAPGAALPFAAESESRLSGRDIAARNAIIRTQPTPDFFEGMLMGNGDIGLCVTVRPDALGLHIGKEDSWDIRVSEDHYPHVLKFKELLELWRRAGEEAKKQGQPEMIYLENRIGLLSDYTKRVSSSYREIWPRPWPCGIVWIHWDSRFARVDRQRLDISAGLLTIALDVSGTRLNVFVLVNQSTGHICVWTEAPAPFLSVAYYPNIDPAAKLPEPEVVRGDREFSCYQHFPAAAPTASNPNPPRSPGDRNFALRGRLAGEWTQLRASNPQLFRLDITLFTPRDNARNVEYAQTELVRLSAVPAAQLRKDAAAWWNAFWSRSAVEFSDGELERIWYHNQYFLACCLREGKVAPGLFGNWSSGRIGTAWHGDYHMNYNTQQVFWGVFSSNHVEQHLPYVELCENLLPLAENYAREKFDMPGGFFPHSAYPVPSRTIAYPVPPWGYEICETPWTVQSLWWHYRYTLDRDFLKRAYPLLRSAARFLAAFVSKGEDGRYHIVPTVSPENWGFTVDYRLNRDCIIDLCLTEFVLEGAAEAARILDTDAAESARWAEIRRNMAPYPRVKGPSGVVWTDVLNGPPEYVYNVPITLSPVFPGEQVGLGLREEQLELARRTARTVRLEGGNDLVFQPLVRARLGILDLNWFKREVRYCLIPNGAATDRTRQIGGRYSDSTNPDFMARMGIWTENLSLPAVLNECMLQSYDGILRVFPNTENLGPASFQDLRAVGAFLVSGSWDGYAASPVTILSEKGAEVRMFHPWDRGEVRVTRLRDSRPVEVKLDGNRLSFPTDPGERYRVAKG